MICIKCGNQVNDTDPFCPFCGAKIENPSATDAQPAVTPVVEAAPATPVVEQPVASAVTPVVEAAPATPAVEQPVAPAVTPVVEAAPVTPAVEAAPAAPQQVIVPQDPATMVTPNPNAQATPVQATPATPEQPKEKKGGSKVVLLVVLLIIAAAVAYVMFGKSLFGGTDEPTTPSTPSDPEPQEVANTEKTETFMGYTFTIPDGYETQIDATYGLTIGNNEVAYSILIDFTNSYDQYLAALKAKYPTQAANLEQTVGTRKFVIGELTSTTGAKGSQYVTAANGNATFIGLVVNKNNTIEYNDYKVLTDILDSSKESGSSFAADDNDPGKNGPVLFDIDRSALGFAE